MEPLATTQRVLTWLWMYSDDEVPSKWQKLGHFVGGQLCLISQLFSLAATTAFVIKFASIDVERSLYAFMFVGGHFNAVFSMTQMMLSRQEISRLFTRLSEIYRATKDDELFEFLTRANDTSERMFALFFQYIFVSLIGIIVSSVASVFICRILHGNYDAQYFFHFPLVLPWNQSSLLCYFAETCFVIIVAMTYILTNGVVALLYISISIHHQSFYEMIEYSIDEWATSDKNQNNEKFLRDLIRFHISAKELFLGSAVVYSPIMAVQLIYAVIALAISIFYMDLQLQQTDFTVAALLSTTSANIFVAFFYCYFGKLATVSFEKMSDSVFEMNWQELPIGLQKYFILMIANMQKPVCYYGGGIVILDLNTFINLLRRVISSYLMFKTLMY